jgi:hypothetical protein
MQVAIMAQPDFMAALVSTGQQASMALLVSIP